MKKLLSALLAVSSLMSVFLLSACDDEKTPEESSLTSVQSSVMEVSEASEPPVESSAESKPVSKAKTPISAAQLSQMELDLTEYVKIPEFNSSAQAINAKSVANGKKITLICDNTDLSYTKLVIQQFKEAADTAGFQKVIVPKTNGTPAAVNDALNSAVNDKADLIIMFGNIRKDDVATNIEYAQANGIQVISAGGVGLGQKDHFVDYSMPVNYQLIGQCLADWTITKKKGKVNALAVNCTDSLLSNAVAAGFQKEFDNYITDATGYCTAVNATSAEIGSSLADQIKQALQKDANLNYIVVFEDAMIPDAVNAVASLGKKIPVIATGGSDQAFDAAKNSSLQMLVAQSFEWTAYGMVDYAVRVLAGSSLPEEQFLPFRILTPDSISKDITNFGGLSGNFNLICFGSYFEYGYSYLWQG